MQCALAPPAVLRGERPRRRSRGAVAASRRGERLLVTPRSTLRSLVCSRSDAIHDPGRPAFLCSCGSPLLAAYDLAAASSTMSLESVRSRPPTMWRYREVLPGTGEPVSLGEGLTP